MTKEAMRFLALNAVLHGHTLQEACEGSSGSLAECLGISEEEAIKLSYQLSTLPTEVPSENKMVMMFLNFYRTDPYTFVAMGTDVVPLSRFIASDLEGQVSDELRYMFVTNLLRDVSQGEQYIEPHIADGVLYCTPGDFGMATEAMIEAYQLHLSGPIGTSRGLADTLRKYTSLSQYSHLSEKMLMRVLKQIVKAKKNATIYQQTILNTSDLLSVYMHTGCIMEFSDSTHTRVNWLLDLATDADNTVVSNISVDTLRTYLIRDVRDLANVKASRGLGEGVKVLFPGVA